MSGNVKGFVSEAAAAQQQKTHRQKIFRGFFSGSQNYSYFCDILYPIDRNLKESETEMAVTILATLMIMVAYFLILYGAVGFIQDKRFFSSAPKENLDAIPDKKQRFPGAHIVGWIIEAAAVLLFIGAVVIGAWDGIRNGFTFLRFFTRFIVMLYCMEIYDILFFDWFLLCHSNFFPHFYPELKGIVGPHMFGYNKKTHIIHFLIYIPVCVVASLICTLF